MATDLLSEPPPPKPDRMGEDFYQACLAVTGKRAQTVIRHILQHGFITTEQLRQDYGYDHPPRAIRDVRDSGIPLETYNVTRSDTKSTIAAYRFDVHRPVIAGRIGGRRTFSKKFKQQLMARYGSRSLLTNEILESRYLQIDHRIPYALAGDAIAENVETHMLLDASAQRAKSWSCEHCANFLTLKDPGICRECFWAFPERYRHVAMRQERRLELAWTGEEVEIYDNLAAQAEQAEQTLQVFLKQMAAEFLQGGEQV